MKINPQSKEVIMAGISGDGRKRKKPEEKKPTVKVIRKKPVQKKKVKK